MRRFLITFATTAVVWVACWFAAWELLRTKGPHGWFNACVALERLEYWTVEYGSEHGALPDEAKLNGLIERAWKENWSASAAELDEPELDFMSIIMEVTPHRSRWLWGRPPKYILDPALPRGCGFFLMGEDGKSMTNGRDPDDLRSWDMDSRNFYYRQLHWQRSVNYGLWSLLPSVFAAWLAWRLTKPRPTSVLRGRYDGSHLPA